MKHLYTMVFLALLIIASGCTGLNNEGGNGSTSSDTSTGQESPDNPAQEEDPMKDNEQDSDSQQLNENDQEENKSDDNQQEDPKGEPASGDESEVITVAAPHELTVVVNKKRKLPKGFEPQDLTVPDVPFPFEEFHEKKQLRLEAAEALEELFQAAEQDGVELVAASGYRSYERQKHIYQNNVRKNGEEHANQFSAKPGTSEHQTGLAMDVTSATAAFKLTQDFIETQEGQWLADHAHEYGFIIRYPEGKTDITGYAYEPWHLRYIGKEAASEIHQQEETLEEFFGLYP